jgi:speckle-type POZ protein
MWCHSCKEGYDEEDAGTCKECYDEASETEEELKREIEELRSRLHFLRLPSPTLDAASAPNCDLLLHAIPSCPSSSGAGGDGDAARTPDTPAVPAHRVILVGPPLLLSFSLRCLHDSLGAIQFVSSLMVQLLTDL